MKRELGNAIKVALRSTSLQKKRSDTGETRILGESRLKYALKIINGTDSAKNEVNGVDEKLHLSTNAEKRIIKTRERKSIWRTEANFR